MVWEPTVSTTGSTSEHYVKHVLARYRRTPGTLGHTRREDRRLAIQLHQRGVPPEVVTAAFALAAARRCSRDPQLPPLPPIRSLHYFVPVIEELLANPIDADYLQYLEDDLRSLDDLPRQPPLWNPRSP